MTGIDRFSGRAVDSGSDDYLRLAFGDLLTTPLGSRVMRRDYGSILPDLIDQPVTPFTPLRIYAGAAMAIVRWIPIARLSRLLLQPRGGPAGAALGAFDLRLQGRRIDRPAGADGFDVLIPIDRRAAAFAGVAGAAL